MLGTFTVIVNDNNLLVGAIVSFALVCAASTGWLRCLPRTERSGGEEERRPPRGWPPGPTALSGWRKES